MNPENEAYLNAIVIGSYWSRVSVHADGTPHVDLIPHDQIYQRPASWFGRFMDWIMACAA